MPAENRCPTCGAILPEGGKCPFCTEALRLVQHLALAEEVRLCKRCGTVLQEGDEGNLCVRCRLAAVARPPVWRREDRIARWLREHVIEPPLAESERQCPQCGKTIPIHSLYCLYCGKPVAESSPSEETPPGSTGVPTSRASEEALPSREAGSEMPAKSPLEEIEETVVEEAVPDRPSFFRRLQAFCQEQFGPLRERVPSPSPRSRISKGLGEGAGGQTWLWVLVGLLLLGLVGIAFFWMTLLSSGGIAFR